MRETGQLGESGPNLDAQFRTAEVAPLAFQKGAGPAAQIEGGARQEGV